MAKATLYFEDAPDGTITVGADFGDKVEDNSLAHGMAATLLRSVLTQAPTYQKIEDTAPETDVEPSRIITSEN